MNENKIVFVLSFIIMLSIFVYFIYEYEKEKRKEKEFAEYKKEKDKEYGELLEKIRKEDSYKWNAKIQAKYNGKLKYKPNKNIKVLVGDYTNSMAPFTNSVLKNMGIDTEVVPTASDIIDRINDGKKYDIIITNNTYSNGESGENVLKLKENKDFSTPIIVLTVQHNSRLEFLSAGFDEYIEKPINEEKVISVFKEFIKDLEFTKIKSNKS